MNQTSATRSYRKTAETWATSLPQRYFVSPDVFREEQANIFARHWLVVGHHSQLSRPGDYFLANIADESVIIVRDQQSRIQAFYNVCRHRGSRLQEQSCGRMATIQCPYHAWSYALDGRLLGAPHMDDVPGFDKATYALRPVNAGTWEGFIFVNLGDRAISLGEWFAPLGAKFAAWNMSILRSARRINYDIRANWKLMFQNYSECYHCPGVHPLLQKISPYDSAENDLTDGPFLGGFMSINKGNSLTMSGHACAPLVGAVEDVHQVFYYSVFPNMLLSLHPEYVMVHQLWPQSPDRTLIVCDWLFHPDAFSRSDFNPDDAIEFWDLTNKQDWHVCELSQQGITSRAYQPGPYSTRESIPAAWDREYLRQMS